MTVLSGISQRQSALFEKQVGTIETLWSKVIDLSPAKGTAQNMSVIKFDAAVKAASEDVRAREVFELIGSNVDLALTDIREAGKVRPFISPVAWAYFSAYSSVLHHAVLKLHMLKSGLNYPDIIKDENLKKVILTALPHQEEYVEKVQSESYYYLLDELGSLMLSAFNSTLKGDQEDRETLLKAVEIIKASEELTATDDLDQKKILNTPINSFCRDLNI